MTSSPTSLTGWRFDNSYAQLPAMLFSHQLPVAVRAPKMVAFNEALAAELGLSGHADADVFAGNVLPAGAEPIAQAYAGHQFGNFTMLGDGRAVLLGEQLTPNGRRVDIQLKGSGQTPYSRSGDGRATLGPMLREYIISEAMHGLRIPTTRSLAVVTTGEAVLRETLLPGAVLTRVAASHIRVGTFEYVAALGDKALLKTLADYAIDRHYLELAQDHTRYMQFLHAVMERQARLVVQWMLVGFIHGVMNTDNTAISGETIDYGPCAFMNQYDFATVFSSIDRHGRYAYGNQMAIIQWNMARFAEAILPLLHAEQAEAITLAEEAIQQFPALFQQHWLSGMRAKLGLFTAEAEDASLIAALLTWMQEAKADYTNSFRALSHGATLAEDTAFVEWHHRWQARLARQEQSQAEAFAMMRASNPAVIARNHRVEEALEAAVEREDLSVLQGLLAALADPYTETSENARYREAPAPSDHIYRTFCGT